MVGDLRHQPLRKFMRIYELFVVDHAGSVVSVCTKKRVLWFHH